MVGFQAVYMAGKENRPTSIYDVTCNNGRLYMLFTIGGISPRLILADVSANVAKLQAIYEVPADSMISPRFAISKSHVFVAFSELYSGKLHFGKEVL